MKREFQDEAAVPAPAPSVAIMRRENPNQRGDKEMNHKNKLFLVLAVLLLFSSRWAQADLLTGYCETEREGVATDIVDLADDTRATNIFVKGNSLSPVLGERLARKLDAAPPREGKPRRGAATKIRQGKDDEAIIDLEDYIVGMAKTKVVEGAEAIQQMLIGDAGFLIGCVLGVSGLPPVE
jgi:hypothetical protein